MTPQNHFDYFIVGQGLAGSTLALELVQRGKRIMVWDQPEENKSSSVAAGLFNPITGRAMVRTWKADLLFPLLEDFYRAAEQVLGRQFFHPRPIYRPFLSVEEQNEWMGKSMGPDWKDYVQQVFVRSQFDRQLKNNLGGLLLSRCGYVDVNAFIDAVRHWLVALHFFRHEWLNEDDLSMDDNIVRCNTLSARRIIFCNGIQAMESRYFRHLPFKPLKGETLFIETEEKLKHIYNRGVYVVPSEGDKPDDRLYRVGATYSTRDLTSGATAESRLELVRRLDDLLILPYTITNQQWGIRPSTLDRRPFLGMHPVMKNAIIFNGLGTKGVSLAPYFAKQLVDWLESELPIDHEVDIRRFNLSGKGQIESEK